MWVARGGKRADLASILAADYEVAIADSPVGIVYRRKRDRDWYPNGSQPGGEREEGQSCIEWLLLGLGPGHRLLLGELPPTAVDYGFAAPQVDRTFDGAPIVMGGETYDHGLGMHAWTRVTYPVPDSAIGFHAVVGLSDEAKGCETAAVTFEVRDEANRVLYESGLVDRDLPPLPIDIELHYPRALTLTLSEGGNGRDCDHANWADAAFILDRQPSSD